MIADKIHTQKGKRSCVRPKRPLDISTKLRCTQIIPILLPSTQTPEEPVVSSINRVEGILKKLPKIPEMLNPYIKLYIQAGEKRCSPRELSFPLVIKLS